MVKKSLSPHGTLTTIGRLATKTDHSIGPVRAAPPTLSIVHAAIQPPRRSIVPGAAMIDVIVVGIVMPALSAPVAELGNIWLAKATRIGSGLLAADAVAQVFAMPVLLQRGDRFGRRPVSVLAIYGSGFGIGYPLTAIAPPLGWVGLLTLTIQATMTRFAVKRFGDLGASVLPAARRLTRETAI